MKKRLLSLLLTGALGVSLMTGCAGQQAKEEPAEQTQQEEPQEEAKEEPVETAQEEPAPEMTGRPQLIVADRKSVV